MFNPSATERRGRAKGNIGRVELMLHYTDQISNDFSMANVTLKET